MSLAIISIAMFCFAVKANAQTVVFPLARQIPADAVAYIGWAGAQAELPAYQASNLSALVDHSNLRKLAGEYAPKLWEQLSGQASDPQVASALRKAMPLLWRHPAAIYLSNVSVSPSGIPRADAALICDAGSDAAALQADLSTVIKINDHLHVFVRDSFVTLGVDDSGSAAPIASLADGPGFLSAMKSLQPASPAMVVYVDAKALLEKADESAAKNPNASVAWPKIKDALGIADVKTFAMTCGSDGSNWATASLIDAPGPRKGLLAAIEPKPLDSALLTRIPASANAVSVYNFDAALMFDTVAQAMAVDESTDNVFHQIAGVATLVLGRNFRREILGSLGPQWVVYSDSLSNDLVLMNHPTSARAAGDSMESAAFGLVNLANAQLPAAATQPINVDQHRSKGVALTTAVTGAFSPTFAVKNQILYFGLSPQAVVTAATRPSCDTGAEFTHSTDFAAAAKALGPADFVSFDYVNIPATAPTAYANFPAANKQLQDLMGMFDINMPTIELPPIALLKPHLTPLFSASWADANGVYSRSISPFPLSGLLLGSPQQLNFGISTISAAVSISQMAGNILRQHTQHANKIGGDTWTQEPIPVLIPPSGVAALTNTSGR